MGSCQNQTASYRLSRTTCSFISASRHVCFILLSTDRLSLLQHAYDQADVHLFDKCLLSTCPEPGTVFYALELGREQNTQNLRKKNNMQEIIWYNLPVISPVENSKLGGDKE